MSAVSSEPTSSPGAGILSTELPWRWHTPLSAWPRLESSQGASAGLPPAAKRFAFLKPEPPRHLGSRGGMGEGGAQKLQPGVLFFIYLLGFKGFF